MDPVLGSGSQSTPAGASELQREQWAWWRQGKASYGRHGADGQTRFDETSPCGWIDFDLRSSNRLPSAMSGCWHAPGRNERKQGSDAPAAANWRE